MAFKNRTLHGQRRAIELHAQLDLELAGALARDPDPVHAVHTCTIPRIGKLLDWGPTDVSETALRRRCALCQEEGKDR